MLPITVHGAAGRMGQAVIRLLMQDGSFKLAGAVDSPSSERLGRDAGEAAGGKKAGVPITGKIGDVLACSDVVVDFSSVAATPALLNAVLNAKKPLVIGTTGHAKETLAIFKEAAKTVPLLVSPNMSIGVNLLWHLTGIAAKTLGKDYQVNIVERHHVHKKDAPSGTAKRIVEIITKAAGYNAERDVFYATDGAEGNDAKPISVHAVREGEIVGEHNIYFTSAEERIDLAHHAFTRDIFARGALKAAQWIVDKPAGLYDMQDVINNL
jgi:4-hydroxy-tetrahydrodipicolinate reductase